MATSQTDVVRPEELEFFIQSLRPFSLIEVGTTKWLDCHEIVIKLSQQAILEASSCREESVKEHMILHGKLQVLVHEAYCILVWKLKILPILLELEPNPPATFLLYTVLYHEGAAISLLEIVLFHQHGCEALGETATDLIDYCAQAVAQLIGLVTMGHHENDTNIDVDETTISELERQKRDLLYKIGIRCLSILNYLADSIENIPISAARRMITVHDIPLLLTQVLHLKPWLRKTKQGFEKLIDEKWVPVDQEKFLKVTKSEAQAWFCLRQLLFSNIIAKNYEINEFRRREISACQGLLNETILDQLPPLTEFKHYLCTMSVTGGGQQSKNQNLILEEVPVIKENLLKDADEYGGFLKIATEQAEVFFTNERDEIFALAKRLSEAYNADLFADMEDKRAAEEENERSNNDASNNDTSNSDNLEKICGNCKKPAEKKCANCKGIYYCSRDCQLESWPTHKASCLKTKLG